MDAERLNYLRELEGRMAAVMAALLDERRPDHYTVSTSAENGEEVEHPDMRWIDEVGDTVMTRFADEVGALTRKEFVVLRGFTHKRNGVPPEEIPQRLQEEFTELGVEILISGMDL